MRDKIKARRLGFPMGERPQRPGIVQGPWTRPAPAYPRPAQPLLGSPRPGTSGLKPIGLAVAAERHQMASERRAARRAIRRG